MSFKTIWLLGIAFLLAGGAFVLYGSMGAPKTDDSMMSDESVMGMTVEGRTSTEMMLESGTEEGMMMNDAYTGTLLSSPDASSPLLVFSQVDYERALHNGDVVLLWFYSSWCPTCAQEQKDIIAAFNASPTKGIVGFRVNIGDKETDSDEEALAREFGVAYRHTKVALRGETRLFKTTEVWNTAIYLEKLSTLITTQ